MYTIFIRFLKEYQVLFQKFVFKLAFELEVCIKTNLFVQTLKTMQLCSEQHVNFIHDAEILDVCISLQKTVTYEHVDLKNCEHRSVDSSKN